VLWCCGRVVFWIAVFTGFDVFCVWILGLRFRIVVLRLAWVFGFGVSGGLRLFVLLLFGFAVCGWF